MAGERALPGLGLFAFWAEGSNGWKDQNDDNIRLVSALLQGAVETRTAAVPAAPANGLIYIVPAGDATNPNKVAIRDNGAWVYATPKEGWRLWVKSEDAMVTFDGAAWIIPTPLPGPEIIKTKVASYTLTLADAGAYLRFDSAGALVVTVPLNSVEPFLIGTTIKVRRANAGTLAIAPTAGVLLNTPETLVLRKIHSTAALVKVAVDSWDVTGDLELSA